MEWDGGFRGPDKQEEPLVIYVGPYEVSGSLRRGTIGAFIITYTIFLGGFFVIITVVECAPNPILIIKALY